MERILHSNHYKILRLSLIVNPNPNLKIILNSLGGNLLAQLITEWKKKTCLLVSQAELNLPKLASTTLYCYEYKQEIYLSHDFMLWNWNKAVFLEKWWIKNKTGQVILRVWSETCEPESWIITSQEWIIVGLLRLSQNSPSVWVTTYIYD